MTALLETVEIPRESDEWQPVDVTMTLPDGSVVPLGKGRVEFAVLRTDDLDELRPGEDDWIPPVDDPEGGDRYGVQAEVSELPGVDGIWVRIDGVIVLDPADVGYLIRT